MFNIIVGLLLVAIVLVIIVLSIFILETIETKKEKVICKFEDKNKIEITEKLNDMCNDGFSEIKNEVKEIFEKDFVIKKRKKEYEKVDNSGFYGIPKDNKMCIRIKGFILRLDVDIAMGTLQRINGLERQIKECKDDILQINSLMDKCDNDTLKAYIELRNTKTNNLIRLKKTLSDYKNDVIEEYRRDD